MLRRHVRRVALTFSKRNRVRKARSIKKYISDQGIATVILSGATGSGRESNALIVERALMSAARVLCGFDVHARGTSPWPFVVADGCHLPYRDDVTDLLVSNAVIEHVGQREDQAMFVAEHLRVGRHCIITTPNRWFPIESHTSAVLSHWSSRWRASRTEFTRLLSRKEFKQLLPDRAILRGRFWSPTFTAMIPPEPVGPLIT